MGILNKPLRKFYLVVADAQNATESPFDVAYFSDATPAGWFECIEDNDSPTVSNDLLQGGEPEFYWKRIVENAGPVPGVTDIVPEDYVENGEYVNKELVVLDGGLYRTTEAHTATASNISNKDKLEVLSAAAGLTDIIPVAFDDVKAEAGVAGRLVKHLGFLWNDEGTHVANEDFKTVNFTRYGGPTRSAWTNTRPYLAGDQIDVRNGNDIDLFEFTASFEIGGSFASAQSSLVRRTPGAFDSINANSTYIKGDVFTLEEGTYIAIDLFTTGASDNNVNDQAADLHKIADPIDGPIKPRAYSDGDNLEANEIFSYSGNLYYTANAIDGSQSASDTWSDIQGDMILVAQVPVAPIPAFDNATVYNQGDKVKFDNYTFTRTSVGAPAARDFELPDWEREIPGGEIRGAFSLSSVYLEGDIILGGNVRYKANSDQYDTAFDEGLSGTSFKRIDTQIFETLTDSKVYIVGDIVTLENVSYVVTTDFETSIPATETELASNAIKISDETFALVHEYVDGDDLKENQIFFSGVKYYRANSEIDGTVDTDLSAVEAKSTVLLDLTPVSSIPDFDETESYSQNDFVKFGGYTWIKNDQNEGVAAWSFDNWERMANHALNRGIFVANQLFLAGDQFRDADSIDYTVNEDTVSLDAYTEALSGAKTVRRLTTMVFETYENDKLYIAGDQLHIGSKSFVVKTSFVSGTSDSIDDQLANLILITDRETNHVPVYTDGDDLEANTFFIHGNSLYYTDIEIDGSVSSQDTWDEIKTSVKVIAELRNILPEFDASLVYSDGDKVTHKGFVFTRNATARSANDPFSLTQFDRDLPAGQAFESFVANNPYLAGDTVVNAGLVYEANTDSDSIASFAEGNASGQFTRITEKVFTSWSAAASIYAKGDVFYLGERSFYAKSAFTTALNDTVDTHLASLQVISDDMTNKVRSYTDGDSFETGEFLTYNSALYFVDSGWVADVAGNTDHEWAAVESNCTLVSSVAVQTSVPFDKTETYTQNDLVEFEGFVFTRNAASRSAGDEFSLTHFDRNISGGQRRGPLSTSAHYLAGDIVVVGGKDYRMNEDVDYNVNDDTVLTEGISGSNTYLRIKAEVFTSVENDKVYIADDLVRESNRTFVVVSSFKTASSDATLVGEANAVMIANDYDVLAPTYTIDTEYFAGNLFKHDQVLYYVHTDITVASNTEFSDMANHVFALSEAPQAVPVAFNPANTYATGDRVNFQNYVWKRNATPRTGGDAFSTTHFDRETVQVDHGALTSGEFTALAILPGDRFELVGIKYSAMTAKETTVTFASLTDGTDYMRLTPQTFSAFNVGDVFILDDVITSPDHYDYLVTNDFTVVDPDPETYSELQAINIVDTYYLGATDAITYHNYHKAGHVWITTAENTAAFTDKTIPSGTRLVLKSDKTSADSSAYADFDVYLADMVADDEVVAVPFNAPDTYAEGDLVSYMGYNYLRNDQVRAPSTAFSLTHFDRVKPGGEYFESHVAGQAYVTGDKLQFGDGLELIATSDIDPSGVVVYIPTESNGWSRLYTTTFNWPIMAEAKLRIGDFIRVDDRSYRLTKNITLSAAPVVNEVIGPNLSVLIANDYDVTLPTYADEEDIPANSIFMNGTAMYYTSVAVDGSDGATDTMSKVIGLSTTTKLHDFAVAAPNYTLTGTVKFGSAPGVVLDKDSTNINVKDATHVAWAVNGTEDVTSLISVTVNGVDKTSEFEVVDVNSIKIKTASSLGLYGDDDIVVTYE